jgi:hypothetical protein
MEQVGLVTLQPHPLMVAMVRPLPQGKGIMEVLGLAQFFQAVEVVVRLLLEQIQITQAAQAALALSSSSTK